MTLGTHVLVNYPINPEALLDEATRLVDGDPATVKRTGPKPSWDWLPEDKRDGTWFLGNSVGQGLRALCDVHWHPDGPLPNTASAWMKGRDVEGIVLLGLDTPYGYRDELGRNCRDLHDDLLVAAFRWLDDQGVPLSAVRYLIDTDGDWRAVSEHQSEGTEQ